MKKALVIRYGAYGDIIHMSWIPRALKLDGYDVVDVETNFKGYYKNSMEAENPSIIVESFILDVSTSQTASPLVTSQLRKIVSFLKQNSANINDPKIKKLFGMLGQQFNAMDKEFGVKTSEADLEEQSNDAEATEASNKDEKKESF